MKYFLACVWAACLVWFVGCDTQPLAFQPNRVHQLKLEYQTGIALQRAADDVQAAVEHYFGLPDQPLVPETLLRLVNPGDIHRAAGPVYSDQEDVHYGLYREHCVVCHGLNGGGAGPAAAMQNPYPRDFRMGIFKFKSTPRGQRPATDDLLGTLLRGEPGTSMPSFAPLPEEDLRAVVQYVQFLSIRGEFERELMEIAADYYADDTDPMETDERLFAPEAHKQDPALRAKQEAELGELLAGIVDRWVAAESSRVAVPAAPGYVGRFHELEESQQEAAVASIARGKELFRGPVANCVGCHGPAGAGDVPTLDYDDWTKDWTTRIGVTPSDKQAVAPFRKAGAMDPRTAQPRNLQHGAFRGGGDPGDLFLRIVHGIEGTPMPAVTLTSESSAIGLTEDQVWDLVNFVKSLSDRDLPAIDPQQVQLPEGTL